MRCFSLFAKPALAIALILIAVQPAGAWGQTGHRIVAAIAYQHLTPKTRVAVDDLLGPRGMAWASTWADEIRGKDAWRHTGPWHYINLADDQDFSEIERNPDGDVVKAIEDSIATLKKSDSNREDRVNALRFLVHFVADVHQPLHAGRGEDRGGNDIKLKYFGEETNLHRVWDTHLIDGTNLSYTEYAAFLNHPTPEQVRAWQKATFADWVHEGRDLRPVLYSFQKAEGDELTNLRWSYVDRARPVVEERLLIAGVRLAGVLEDVFNPQ